MTSYPRCGQIYWVRMPSEPEAKKRPALVVSMNTRNRLAPDVMVVPITTMLRPAPTHVRLKKNQAGIPKPSMVKCEQLTTLPKSLLSAKPLGGQLSPAVSQEVEKAILRAIAVPIP